MRRGFLIFNHGTMLTSLSESVTVVIAAEKLLRNIAASAELTRQAGWQSGGIIDRLGFVVLGTFLMARTTPPVLTQAFVMGAGGGAGAGGVGGAAVMTGVNPYSGAYSDSGPCASYLNRLGTKATQKGKKANKLFSATMITRM